jgi:hypothetical protein
VLLIGPSVRSLELNRVVFWFLPKLDERRIASELEYVINFYICFCLYFDVRADRKPSPYSGTVIPEYGERNVTVLLEQ